MHILKFIRPEKPLKELKWYDIAIVTVIMFGQFIVWSTELFLASLHPVAQTVSTATETWLTCCSGISILNSFQFDLNGPSSFGYL